MPKEKKLSLDWQPHKAEIQNLYLVRDLPLERLMRHMKETHGFRATKAQYETQLKKWDIRKNLTNVEWNYTLLQVRKRKFDGKESDVYLNGRVVPEKRIKKEMSRHFTLTQEQLFHTVSIPSTPEAITVSTPNATVPTAPGNIILANLPYFQFQALLDSAAIFPMRPSQSPRIGTTRQIALDSQVVNLPSLASRVSDKLDALALFQGIASPSHSTSNGEGQTLLARLFGPRIRADGDGFLSQIRSQMLVSSLERYDGELLEKSQLLCGPSRQSSVLVILEFALYRMSNNLLSEEATDEFTRWLIEQQQNGLLASFLQTQMPTVHACATKILESVLRIGDANFLKLLIDSGIDNSPLKGVYGGRNLEHAAFRGNMQIVQILLKNGADVNIIPSEQDLGPALLGATRHGHAQMVQVLLKAGANVDADSTTFDCNTALSIAANDENIELVRILLNAGANIDICTNQGLSTIEYSAFYCRNDELHQILVSASRKGYSSIRCWAVLEAASTGTQALSKYLAEKGKTGALVQEVLDKALEQASNLKNDRAVTSLLDVGVPLPPSDEIRDSLQDAVYNGYFGDIKKLVQEGADLLRILDILCVMLRHPVEMPYGIKMIQFLLDEGADFKTHGGAALRYAAYIGSLETAQSLVLSGVDVNAETDDTDWFVERTVLQNAVSGGKIEMVNFLLDAGADVNVIICRKNPQTALEIAIRNVSSSSPQKLEMVHVLLAAGADVNIPEQERIYASILQSAIAKGDEELVSILIKAGADVNSPPVGFGGRSPVQEAATTGNLSLIKLLLESGADINAPAGDYYGRTAIQAASSSELPTMELIDFLLNAGADMNAPAGLEGGVTALQGAAISGHMGIALKFLEAGADVNADPASYFERTALDGAAEHGRLDMVQMLLEAGACGDSTKSHRFENAIELARYNGHFAIASLLERA